MNIGASFQQIVINMDSVLQALQGFDLNLCLVALPVFLCFNLGNYDVP